ncbi:hypothetical protein ACSSNL_03220 [Thalassobius sp. S69A]|uniref:hypothetical protein n=1 Tax=unclassified Thalassovita TaxID=2619711 RepID=UPI003C7BB123
MTVLMLLAAPAAAQQVARIVPADFKIHAEPALGVCVASDHVISARKAGMDVALVLGRDGAAEMIIQPDRFDRKALLPQILEFTFEDSMTLRAAARLKNGRFLLELHDGQKAEPLFVALRQHSHSVITLPLRPEDRIGLDLTTMPAVFAQLETCLAEQTQ